MFSELALKAVNYLWEFNSVLDIGSGNGVHATHFRDLNKHVTTVSLEPPADYVGDYLGLEFGQHDLVWASHVLEHQPNVNLFLKKCFTDCGRYFCVTVPPLKHQIVGGHVSLWNGGLLLYNLVLAGWDCSKAKVISDGYNLSVLVEKRQAALPQLSMDHGDIGRLAKFFPVPVDEGFDGRQWE